MILPSIGILKAQRRRGEKKKTYFLFTKKIFENQYFFQNLFFENNFGFISHVQCLFILIYKRGQSFQFLSLTFLSSLFSLKKFSPFFFTSQITQPILIFNPSSKAENFSVVFLTTKTDKFNSRKRVQRFSPESLILSLQTGSNSSSTFLSIKSQPKDISLN